MSSFLDLLPSHERNRLRQRLRSPAEYERLREKVKGPEDLKREMAQNEALADLQLDTELHRMTMEKMKTSIAEGIRDRGIETVIENTADLPPEVRQALESGNFSIVLEEMPNGATDQIALLPQGNVSEKIQLSQSISDHYMAP